MNLSEIDKLLGRGRWDKNRGIQPDTFCDALTRAKGVGIPEDLGEGSRDSMWIGKTPGTDIVDPYASQLKPKGVPVWDHIPADEEEEGIYYGVHMHSESNPLGLHSHVVNGTLSGGHSHGPQNRFGAHHHKKDTPLYGVSIDGSHVHEGENHPGGGHVHVPENFG